MIFKSEHELLTLREAGHAPYWELLASSIASCSISCAATLPAVPPHNATSGCFCQEWSSLGSWPRDEMQDGKG